MNTGTAALARITDGHIWPSPAQELLLEAAVTGGARSIEAFTRWQTMVDVEQPFDWEMNRLLPLVYHRLHEAGYAHRLMPRLKGTYRKSWAESTQLQFRTGQAVRALRDADIPILLLKGLPLGLAYYGNIALRPMSDVDLAVRTVDARRAMQVLTRSGWRAPRGDSPNRLRWTHAMQFFHPDHGEFDLHWRVMLEATDAEHEVLLWQHTETLVVDGQTLQILAPTEQLFHAVLHGIRWNAATPIRWITDSLTIMQRRGTELDWPRFLQLARAMRVTLRVHLGLQYLVERFGAAIPAWLLDDLAAERPSWRERLEARIILADQRGWDTQVRFKYWRHLGDFARVADWRLSMPRFTMQFLDYLCFELQLSGRPQLIKVAARGVGRHLAGRRRHHTSEPIPH